ncbi:MAG: translesion error-prone DNA polymerase V autoproteolytic subunit [Muribaculaceae bacterium]|nr:translesion error-prone DNA polymerase V autoproteolytic subunit [Muribaculaceae bacterium]
MNDSSIHPISKNENIKLPILEGMIPAGFPSPLQGLVQDAIDLNRELIDHPAATFCARVTGNSMIESGISDGDLLIIDKSLDPQDNSIAVCFIDGEFTLKRISIRKNGVFLVPANPKYKEIAINEDSNFQVWGIVTFIIKSVNR